MPEHSAARARREIIRELLHCPLREGESIRDFPFEFLFDSGGGAVEGCIRVVDIVPKRHARFVSDSGFYVSWTWLLSPEPHWHGPQLCCPMNKPRSGTMVLKPPSHTVRN